jgi:hypothetical protein
MFLPKKPPEGSDLHRRICCMGCTGGFSASRTVTVDKAIKRQGNLKPHTAAQAAATYLHCHAPLSRTVGKRVTGSTKKP